MIGQMMEIYYIVNFIGFLILTPISIRLIVSKGRDAKLFGFLNLIYSCQFVINYFYNLNLNSLIFNLLNTLCFTLFIYMYIYFDINIFFSNIAKYKWFKIIFSIILCFIIIRYIVIAEQLHPSNIIQTDMLNLLFLLLYIPVALGSLLKLTLIFRNIKILERNKRSIEEINIILINLGIFITIVESFILFLNISELLGTIVYLAGFLCSAFGYNRGGKISKELDELEKMEKEIMESQQFHFNFIQFRSKLSIMILYFGVITSISIIIISFLFLPDQIYKMIFIFVILSISLIFINYNKERLGVMICSGGINIYMLLISTNTPFNSIFFTMLILLLISSFISNFKFILFLGIIDIIYFFIIFLFENIVTESVFAFDFNIIVTYFPIFFIISIFINRVIIGFIIEQENQYYLLKESEEKNIKISQDLENYIHIISHDLKTPVVSIEGFASLFQERTADKLDEKSLHYLNRIQSNAISMHKLILNILEISRASQTTQNLSEIDVLEILDLIKEEFEFFFDGQKIDFIIENKENFQKIIFERTKLQQIFHNLISNAVKYCGNKENKKITIRYEHLKNKKLHSFQVEDTGIGIEEKDFQKVFELFQTIDYNSSNEIKNNSTGVGLGIVKKILESYNGDIWFESKFGVGTTFHFTIPVINQTKIIE
ncbi:MAG: HAMP domain-containing histidine kinase [archaeon]|nr:HAMP domain-containing histidine kinase [archaeon]